MKSLKLLLTAFVLCSANDLFSQEQKSEWFTATKINSRVWRIDDHLAANLYLISGTDSALLIDTGIGAADLVSFIKKVTNLPLRIINTHGHGDHAGADYQFSKIFISALDSTEARQSAFKENRVNAAINMLRGASPEAGYLFKGKEIPFDIVPITEGMVFHLGGCSIEVIETPGHTPGSICLLDREDKLLFTGDNDNTAVWLFLPNSLPLEVYLNSLKKLLNRCSEFDTLLPGHGIPKPADFIGDQVECVKEILNHSITPEIYESFAGKAMLAKYGRASVAFNPGNLYKK